MNLFDVYPLFDINPVKAQGSWLWDDKGEKYLEEAKYDSFGPERRESIKQRAKAMAAEFAQLREQRGLGPYDDEIFDGAAAMGIPEDVFSQLYAEYTEENAQYSAIE